MDTNLQLFWSGDPKRVQGVWEMTVFKWFDSFNTGINQFDEQHKKIIDLINTSYESVRQKKEKEISLQVIEDLLSYTLYHFENEERWMKLHEYPDQEQHVAEHASLKNSVEQFRKGFDTDFEKNQRELYHFLRDWLTNHIKVSDKKLGDYLLNEG